MQSTLAARLLITFGAMFYLVVIPLLEWNSSHVFNPLWPPHARFHEVWQLLTNAALGVLVLWLAWRLHQIKLAALISVLIMGGVVGSHVLSKMVGGSVISGNFARKILGLEIAVFFALVVIAAALLAAWLEREKGEVGT